MRDVRGRLECGQVIKAAQQQQLKASSTAQQAQPRRSSRLTVSHLTPPLSRTCTTHSLLESEHGNEIDGNDCVWRMNRAPTKGYEKHVCVITATERDRPPLTYIHTPSQHTANAPLSLTAVSAAAVCHHLCCCDSRSDRRRRSIGSTPSLTYGIFVYSRGRTMRSFMV